MRSCSPPRLTPGQPAPLSLPRRVRSLEGGSRAWLRSEPRVAASGGGSVAEGTCREVRVLLGRGRAGSAVARPVPPCERVAAGPCGSRAPTGLPPAFSPQSRLFLRAGVAPPLISCSGTGFVGVAKSYLVILACASRTTAVVCKSPKPR